MPVALLILLLLSPFVAIYGVGKWRPSMKPIDRVIAGLLIAVVFGVVVMGVALLLSGA